MKDISDILETFIKKHQLPESYIEVAQHWFIPLADKLASHHDSAGHPIFVGINGSQGSGKSTLCTLLIEVLTEAYAKSCTGVSIDDFYLSKLERSELSKDVHPLFATRGVPGTHNVELMDSCFSALLAQKPCLLPVFEKSKDDVAPMSNWRTINDPQDIIILEGWCVGVSPQTEFDLLEPVNDLERRSDPDAKWRKTVNQTITDKYCDIFEKIDQLIMLKAPSFDCVYRWRCEQEHKLIASLKCSNQNIQGGVDNTMSDKEISVFVQFYQRLTEHSLITLPDKADYLYKLNKQRGIESCQIK